MDTESPTPARGADVRRPAWPASAARRRPSGLDRPGRASVPRGTWAAAAVFLLSVTTLVVLRVADGDGGGTGALDAAAARFLRSGEVRLATAERLTDLEVLGYRTLWIPCALVLAWFARWRGLVVYLGTISIVAAAAQVWAGSAALARVVRIGVTGSAEVLVVPAWPVIVLSTVAVASLYALVPGGRPRWWGWGIVLLGIATMAAVRVTLGLDSASVTVTSAAIGSSAAVLAFHLFAPESQFPVRYHREVKAHLRLEGERTERVLRAVHDQLGIDVTGLEPYRLDGSAGSTPCRLTTAGPPGVLFGKLYATPHLRSDRWYKLARVLRYGRLEDEAPFASVRRLAEHEDYMLRLLRDGGVRVPEPGGVVEVLPGREYLLVTELVPGSVEILDAEMTDAVIDDAVLQVRLLWQAGAAHRDVKPSNVLARGQEVYLVDVSFGELRPSRWRQAVDLANMMLTLGLAAGADRVVARAALQLDRLELAEAFAATSSLTMPRQLHRLVEESGHDLVAEFRALLPAHERIRVQRWDLRRVLLALGTLGGVVSVVVVVALNLRAGGLL